MSAGESNEVDPTASGRGAPPAASRLSAHLGRMAGGGAALRAHPPTPGAGWLPGALAAGALAVLPVWWHLTLATFPAPGMAEVQTIVAVYPADVFLALLALHGTIVGARGGWATRRPAWLLQAAAGLLPAAALASALAAPLPPLAANVAGHLALLGLAWQGARAGSTSPRWLAAGLVAAALPQALLALGQFLVQSPLLPEALQLPWLPGGDPSVPGATVVLDSQGRRVLRAFGTFPHPNLLGGYLALALVFLPWLATGSRSRWLCWAAGALLAAGLLASFSRAGWLAAGVGLGVWWLGAARGAQLRWALAGLVVLAALLASPLGDAARTRLAPAPTNALEDRSVQERLWLVEVARAEIIRHPLLGTGAGNFALASLLDGLQSVPMEQVHVVSLLAVAELGLPGALALALAMAGCLVELRRQRGQRVGAAAALAALTVLALLDHYLWTMPPGHVLAWAAASSLWAGGGRQKAEGRKQKAARNCPLLSAFCLLPSAFRKGRVLRLA
ncbi:MAG: O-antigen ligase family protein [Chloroflexi bacterium]|nr:O-antigen ligase family protein [Chloroflexota bacterium]